MQLSSAEAQMKLSVYAGHTCFIVTHEFLQPPSATSLYAPLRLRGYIATAHLPQDQRDLIHTEMKGRGYAIVAEEQVLNWNLSRSP